MKFLVASLSLFLSSYLLAHEMWLQPDRSGVDLQMVVGQNFRGAQGVWIDHEVARAQQIWGDRRTEFEGRYGDRPALKGALADQPDRVIYQSSALSLTYREGAKFESFGVEKGYPGLFSQHQARGLGLPIRERYTRYAKYLSRADAQDPLFLQFVVTDGRAVLLRDGVPLAGHRVHWYSVDQVVVLETDSAGMIKLPVFAGPQLLDAVWIEPAEGSEAHWHSHWASTYIDP